MKKSHNIKNLYQTGNNNTILLEIKKIFYDVFDYKNFC